MSVNITAAMVSELRQRTSAGMMECKKALEKTGGDMKLAEIEIAKAGNRKAEKTATRTAAEGVIMLAATADNRKMTLVEVNCETDFVAKDSNFLNFCQSVAQTVLLTGETQVETLKAHSLNGSSVEETRQALVGKIGENIQVRRAVLMNAADNELLGAYVHGGRIGVLIRLQGGDAALAKDLAMHIAANNPEYISSKDVPSERVAQEKEIFMAQGENSGKPKEIVEKMLQGRLNKYFNEICLLGQPFVKNPEQTVEQLLKAKNASVLSYVRFSVGEGIEKKAAASFAEEVAQISGGK